MFQVFSWYVASIVYRCYKSRSGCCTCSNGYIHVCFACIFQMFHLFKMNVANDFVWMLQKVDLDVACTCMLQAYVSSVFRYFIHMFASLSSGCCICSQWFSNVFHVFLQVFQTLISRVSSIFFCMLQLLHLDVLKLDRVLHMG
jgi:hypothetical protein